MEQFFYKASAYINGKFIDTEQTMLVHSAIDGTVMGSLPTVSKHQVDIAYEGAFRSFNIWKNLSHEMRIKKIKEFAEIFIQDKEELAKLMVYEIGKSYKDALVEVQRSYEYIIQTIEVYEKKFIKPYIIDSSVHNIEGKVGKFYNVPIGVILAISPFNYPINLSIAKIIPSILVGNTIVFKPATQGALVASKIAKYFDDVKLIPGVFNLIIGKGSEIGDYIVENKRIAGATFTGSTNIGKKIAQKLYMKPIVLELGGKDVAIVTNKADIIPTAKEIVKGAFNFSGQRCTAIKKVLVMEEVADFFVNNVLEEVKKLKVGSPLENVDVVPLIDKKSLDFNLGLIEDAKKHNATILYGGNVVGFNLLEPTLIDNVTSEMRIAWEEPFGPILPIVRVKSVNEAIAIANSSEYGLQGSVFSQDLNEANMIAKHLDTGTVNINKSSSRGPDIFPFIGIKDSGFGVQGIEDSLRAMTRIKGIVENN